MGYTNIKDLEKALYYAKKAIELAPDDAKYKKNAKISEFNYFYNEGAAAFNAKKFKDALDNFEKVLKIGKEFLTDEDIAQTEENIEECIKMLDK